MVSIDFQDFYCHLVTYSVRHFIRIMRLLICECVCRSHRYICIQFLSHLMLSLSSYRMPIKLWLWWDTSSDSKKVIPFKKKSKKADDVCDSGKPQTVTKKGDLYVTYTEWCVQFKYYILLLFSAGIHKRIKCFRAIFFGSATKVQ